MKFSCFIKKPVTVDYLLKRILPPLPNPIFGRAWQAYGGLDLNIYLQEFDQLAAQGYRLKVVSGYMVSGTDLYAAIWDKSVSRGWEAHHLMNSREYQATFEKIVWTKGYQQVWVSGYEINGEIFYAAIWEAP